MIELTDEFVAGLLGITAEEVTKSLKDGDAYKPQDEIESFIKTTYDGQIASVRHKFKKDGYQWGERESLTKKVKEFKEKFGVEGDTLDEVVDNLIETTTKKSNLTPDDVRNSEIFQTEIKKYKTLLKEKEDELLNKESSFNKAETMRLAKEYGMKFLKEKNYVLDDDADILDEKLENLFSKIEDENTKLNRDGNRIIVFDGHGRPKENETGTKEISYDDLLGIKAKRYFKQAVADNRQSPANKTQAPKDQATNPNVPEIKTTADIYAIMNDTKLDFETKKTAKAQYDKMVEEGTIS